MPEASNRRAVMFSSRVLLHLWVLLLRACRPEWLGAHCPQQPHVPCAFHAMASTEVYQSIPEPTPVAEPTASRPAAETAVVLHRI